MDRAATAAATAGAIALGLALGPALPRDLPAQAHAGGQVSLAEDSDFGLGGRLLFNVEDMEGWEASAAFDLFFPDGGVDYWEVNGNLLYNFKVEPTRTFFPYVGGGLNIATRSFDGPGPGDGGDTHLGLNLVGGGKFDARGTTPFVEIRLEIEGGEQFVVSGGLLFP